jgi:RNA polymerase sigma factor FliA
MLDITEAEQIEQYHATQDQNLREVIILRYIPLVHYILRKLGISPEMGADYDDFISQGILGLIDALDRFESSYGTQFSTYATIKVRGKILDTMRSMDWLSRTARKRAKTITDGMNDFWEKNHRMPTDAELAQAINLDVAQVQEGLIDSSRVIISLDTFDNDSDDENIMHETLADGNQEDPAELIHASDTKRQLMIALKSLSEREQLLLSLYYFEDLTFKEIGEVLGVSESRICQIHGRAVTSLKTMMNQEPALLKG